MKLSTASKPKKLVITGILATIVWVLLIIGLLKLGQYYASDILYQLVKQETNGRYKLSFESLDFDIRERTITIDQILLSPDSTKDWGTENIHRYALELSSVVMNLESISSIYLNRELLIKNVRIIDPKIDMIRDKDAPTQSFSLETGNLYQLLSNYLKVLRIDYFELKNGEFGHSPSNFSLGNIDFIINDLLMSAASNPEEKFYSENIELEIRDQRFELRDSIHVITFDRFILSTADSVLSFDNLIIKPIDETILTSNGLPGLSIYNITVPQLRLRGVDYFSAYRKNVLKVDELVLLNSIININDQTGLTPKEGRNTGNSLLVVLNQIFDEVEIGKLRSLNTHIDIHTDHKTITNLEDIKVQRADIVFYAFQLNSDNSTFDITKRYFANVDVIIKDYYSQLTTGFSSVSFDLLELSSFDSTLIFNDLKLNNSAYHNDSIPAITLTLPHLSLQGLDYEALLVQQLLVHKMELNRPRIEIERIIKRQTAAPNPIVPGDFHAVVGDKFSVVRVSRVDINSGHLSYQPSLSVDEVNLGIINLSIDDATTSWHEVFEEINVEASDINYKDQNLELTGDRFKIERTVDRLDLIDWQFNFQNDRQTITGDVGELQVLGIHLDSILSTNNKRIDSIFMNDANFKIDYSSLNEKNPKAIHLEERYIAINRGKFEIAIDSSSFYNAEIISAELTTGSQQQIYGVFENIDVRSPKIGHDITVDHLEISPSGELISNNLNISSKYTSGGLQFNGTFTDLKVTGLDQRSFWSNNYLKGDSIILNSPKLTIHSGTAKPNLLDSTSYQIQFNMADLKLANLTFLNEQLEPLTELRIGDTNLQLEEVNYPYSNENDKNLFFARNFNLLLKDIKPQLANSDSLTIGNLEFDKRNNHLKIEKIIYSDSGQTTAISLPKVVVRNLDIDRLVFNKAFAADNFELTKGNISLPNPLNQENTTDAKLPNITVDEIGISLDQIEIERFFDGEKVEWTDLLHAIGSATFKGEHLNFPLRDEYVLGVGDISYQYPNNTLGLLGIDFSSNLSASAYSAQLEYQSDWFDMHSNSIHLTGLNANQCINDQKYHIQKMHIGGLEALIYRDKSVERAPNQVKHLPQRMLKELQSWILVDTLNVTGDIRYQEKLSESEDVGEISFNDLNGNLYHITTVDSLFKSPMRLSCEGLLMGDGKFEVAVLFDMNNPFDQFAFVGEVNDMALDSMNRMLRPSSGLNIRSGNAKKIWFNVRANNQLAKGQMKLRYNDLKIQILNRETHDTKGFGQGIRTFLANTFVVKSNNPTFLFLRNGKIFQERDPSRSIFHYWGKLLLSGAASSVGIQKSTRAEKQYGKGFEK